MNTVVMLVYKDLMQQSNRILIGSFILIMIGILFILTDGIGPAMLNSLGIALGLTTTIGLIYEDEQGGLAFLRTLPLKPVCLIVSRYLAALLIFLIFSVFICLPNLLAPVKFGGLSSSILTLVSTASVGLLMVGFMLLLFYRYGYRAIRWGFIAVFSTVMLIPIAVNGLRQAGILGEGPPLWLATLFSKAAYLMDTSLVVAISGVVLIALLFYAALGWLAARSLAGRDL
jgi:hypothetical protein